VQPTIVQYNTPHIRNNGIMYNSHDEKPHDITCGNYKESGTKDPKI